jgi:hypothetical protein
MNNININININIVKLSQNLTWMRMSIQEINVQYEYLDFL